MMKLVRRLLIFSLVLEGLGTLRLPVLLATITVFLSLVVCIHFLLVRRVNSA